MIEKLPFTEIHTGGEDMVGRVEFRPVPPYETQHKINELVDAVNGILDYAPLEMAQKAEPEYKNRNVKQAEKWMYCLCRFWNDGCDSYYGELVNIDTKVSSDAPFERDTGDWYQCCEPVKPDDDIIYKGGDNALEQITALEQKDVK